MSPCTDAADNIRFPAHAYVPGENSRHSDGWFDDIKDSVSQDIPVNDLHRTHAFQVGRAYFDQGYYWECHEVLEAVWLRTGDPSPERDMVQALIQLANARLKLRMGKPNAARRLCDMVEAHLARCAGANIVLGLNVAQMQVWVDETRQQK